VVGVCDAGPEADAIADAERMLAVLIDQHYLARQHEDELVLALVPMAQEV
jgi:hypothetical protein